MKRKINRSKIALIIVIAGLAVALTLPRLNVRSSASAQNANNGATSDYFGYSVAIKSGTTGTVVAGALYDDIGLISNQGSAYVFIRL